MDQPVRDLPRVRLADCFGRQLVWIKPKLFGRSHELWADQDLVAVMQWMMRSASARTSGGNWVLRRTGVIGSGAELLDADSQRVVLTIRTGFRSGSFTDAAGVVYPWKRTRFFRLEFAVLQPQGSALLTCRTIGLSVRRLGTVSIEGAGVNHPLLDPLVIASWYVMRRLERRRRHAG